MIFSTSSGGGGGSGASAQYTYTISQNSAGTVYTAYNANGGVLASSSVPDIAPVLSAAINALITAGQGGRIFIKAGTYFIVDNWVSDPAATTNYGVINIPVVATAANTMSITIEGECSGAVGQVYTGFSLEGLGGSALNTVGVQIKTQFASTALPGSNGNSVFYAQKNSGGFGGTNYLSIGMFNIRWTQQTNQWTSGGGNRFTMVDATYLSGFFGDNLVLDTQVANSAVMPECNTNSSYGVKFPSGSNQGQCGFGAIAGSGFGDLAYLQDHANIKYLYAQACRQAIGTANNSFSAEIDVANIQECLRPIDILSNQSFLNIKNLSLEFASPSGGNSWQVFGGLFNNTNLTFSGNINLAYGVAGSNSIFATLNSPALGTMPAAGSNYTLRWIQNPINTISGSVGGSVNWTMIEMGSGPKKLAIQYNAYESTANTITFPVPFNLAPSATFDSSTGGGTISATTYVLKDTHLSALTGMTILEGI